MELYICFYNYFSTNMTLLTELILILLPRKIPKNLFVTPDLYELLSSVLLRQQGDNTPLPERWSSDMSTESNTFVSDCKTGGNRKMELPEVF